MRIELEIRTHATSPVWTPAPYSNDVLTLHQWMTCRGGHLLVTTDESRMWGCAESRTLTGYFATQCAFEKSKGTHRNLTMSISDRIYLARAARKLFFLLHTGYSVSRCRFQVFFHSFFVYLLCTGHNPENERTPKLSLRGSKKLSLY